MRISTVLAFSLIFTSFKACLCFFVLMQSLKTSPALLTIIITFSTVLFCKQKLLNSLSITHDPRLRKHCISSDPLTPPRGSLTGVKLGQETQAVRFSQLAWCIHIWEPRGDCTIMDSAYIGLRLNGVAVYKFHQQIAFIECVSQCWYCSTLHKCTIAPVNELLDKSIKDLNYECRFEDCV